MPPGGPAGKGREMFEKFGEMGSHRELDELAKNLWREGDRESLTVLCKENGLDYQDIEDAAEDGIELWITPTMAAIGRIRAEEEQAPGDTPKILFEMARVMAADPKTAPVFMTKGKSVRGVYKHLESIARKNRKGNMGVACGTDRELTEIILSCYREATA